MAENDKQGEIKTSDELQAEQMEKAGLGNDTAQDNLDNGSPEGQGVADNPDEPLSPNFTGTKDTSDT